MSLLTFYTLRNPKNSLDKILKLMVTTTRSNVKSRSNHDVAHLQPLINVPTNYQLPTPYDFRDIARTRFYKSSSLQQGQRSNQGHTTTLHTYNPQSPTKYQLPTSDGFRDISRMRFYRARSQLQGHATTLHIYNPSPMSLPSINFLHLTVSEIQPGQDFQTQGHYGKVKGQIKVTPRRYTPTPPTNVPTTYQLPTPYGF